MSEPLYCEEHPPVDLDPEDLRDLYRLVPGLYKHHNVTPKQAINRYLAYVGAGLDDLNRFLAGHPTRR